MSVLIPSLIKLNGNYLKEDSNSTLLLSVCLILPISERRDFRLTHYETGQTGLGKSTLINTIFAAHLIDSKGRLTVNEPVRQTTEIQAVSHGNIFFTLSSLTFS